MSAVQVQFLINLIGPQIVKQDTIMRSAIPVYERVMVTLRFLATGDSYSSLQYLFRIPVCTIGRIVKEVTVAIYEMLKESYLKFPNTKNEWLCIANSFHSRWNFPHCVGAVDGKHVSIQNPHNSGSHYFNYKGTYSIILLAVADASYKLIYFDVGCNGRISDGGVFQNSSLHQGLEDGSIELPEPTPLPGRTDPVPYCFFGDDAFAMKPYMLKPYPYQNQPAPNRIFNYRLSRARRIIENVFGIMANKFRVLRKPIALAPETVSTTVQAICALHNYLLSDKTLKGNYIHQDLIDTENTETHTLIPGSWRDEIPNNSYFPLQKGK
ncbi:hypothetical protein PPYR_05052 [Photinus pyralis]|uniref:DDE Tnp4 domain-containing protein n=1 Tax=Photinus pyralis TaxID=7054 RepID=A0A5N4AZX3_PHOPY|nr:hypothetical protein PPYR_05052 [Photinus pyralis]